MKGGFSAAVLQGIIFMPLVYAILMAVWVARNPAKWRKKSVLQLAALAAVPVLLGGLVLAVVMWVIFGSLAGEPTSRAVIGAVLAFALCGIAASGCLFNFLFRIFMLNKKVRKRDPKEADLARRRGTG